jgi:hypothetical protein
MTIFLSCFCDNCHLPLLPGCPDCGRFRRLTKVAHCVYHHASQNMAQRGARKES